MLGRCALAAWCSGALARDVLRDPDGALAGAEALGLPQRISAEVLERGARRAVVQRVEQGAARAAEAGVRPRATELSPCQKVVMDMLAEGLSVKEIGRRLQRSPATISTTLCRAREKLGADTPKAAVIKYVRSQYTGWAGEIEYLSWGKS